MQKMHSLIDVHTYYGKSYVLPGISLEVKTGSIVALLGRNGMGKTITLIFVSSDVGQWWMWMI